MINNYNIQQNKYWIYFCKCLFTIQESNWTIAGFFSVQTTIIFSCVWKSEKKFFATLEMSRPIILHRKIPFHHLKRTKAENFFFLFSCSQQLAWWILTTFVIDWEMFANSFISNSTKNTSFLNTFFPMQNWRASKVYLGKAYFSRDNFQFMNLSSKIKDFFKFLVDGKDFVTYYLVARQANFFYATK